MRRLCAWGDVRLVWCKQSYKKQKKRSTRVTFVVETHPISLERRVPVHWLITYPIF